MKKKANSISVNVILDETEKMALWRRAAKATLKAGWSVTMSDIVREILHDALSADILAGASSVKSVDEIVNETAKE